MNCPRYSLAIDNCFASKRWTTPAEWMRIAADCGIPGIEASADTECDSLYSDTSYLRDWLEDVRRASQETGVKVVNFYSGHGTYTTLGLAHPDERNANRMRDDWLGAMLTRAAELQSGVGFFCHAFSQAVLQSPVLYREAWEKLCDRLATLATRAKALGVQSIGVEQMYSPNQVPWRIHEAKKMLREIYQRSGCNFYLTIDTGHQSGQHKFLRPTAEKIEAVAANYRRTGSFFGQCWLGPDKAYSMVAAGESPANILDFLAQYDYMFAEPEDADTYAWLRELGQYSPIVHLQQTDGFRSGHLPFDEEHNKTGVIKAEKVLEALDRSAENPQEDGMPQPCQHHALTLEIFAGTAEIPQDTLRNVKVSADYWNKYLVGKE